MTPSLAFFYMNKIQKTLSLGWWVVPNFWIAQLRKGPRSRYSIWWANAFALLARTS